MKRWAVRKWPASQILLHAISKNTHVHDEQCRRPRCYSAASSKGGWPTACRPTTIRIRRFSMGTRKSTAFKVYELQVELEDIEPLIWRRLWVPSAIGLSELHDLLQLAMGWMNSHLHSF